MITALPNYDWLYQVLGGILAIAGLALLIWALFWDRHRRNRRCSRCWYDMSGTPGLRCPECGTEFESEKPLHRRRRRWRAAGLAVILMLVLGGLETRHLWKSGRAYRYLPNIVIVAFSDVTTFGGPVAPGTINQELRDRVVRDSLGERSWRMLLSRVIGSPGHRLITYRSHWPRDQSLQVCINMPEVSFVPALLMDVTRGRANAARIRLAKSQDGSPGPWVTTSGIMNVGPVSLGLPPASGPVQLDIEFFRDRTQLWTGRVPLAIGIRDRSLQPVSSPGLDQSIVRWMRPRLTDSGLYVRESDRGRGIGRDISLGATFHIMLNGVERGTASNSWHTELASFSGQEMSQRLEISWNGSPPSLEETRTAGWSVRIQGDRNLALLDFDQRGWEDGSKGEPWDESDEYWSGSVVVPLKWEQ